MYYFGLPGLHGRVLLEQLRFSSFQAACALFFRGEIPSWGIKDDEADVVRG